MAHPKKWYIPVTKENHAELNRWRLSKRTLEASKWDEDFVPGSVLVSEHPSDGSYFYTNKYLRMAQSLDNYPTCGYQEITLEQFRQITNPQPMTHPEHWCIEATKENFSELKAWWEENADTDYHFKVGYTLMSQHPKDRSKYYGGSIASCLDDYPQFVEITLEQFRQITKPNQTTMSKPIQISRELLNEYYEAATTPQKAYLTEHFKLDGTTTVKAIRGLHDMACEGWKPKIKKNHPDCFSEDSKYFDFSEYVNRNKSTSLIPKEACESLGLVPDFIQVRNTINPETHHRSFYLSKSYKWELKFDGDAMVLIPTKK
jgi:hypothetical protein